MDKQSIYQNEAGNDIKKTVWILFEMQRAINNVPIDGAYQGQNVQIAELNVLKQEPPQQNHHIPIDQPRGLSFDEQVEIATSLSLEEAKNNEYNHIPQAQPNFDRLYLFIRSINHKNPYECCCSLGTKTEWWLGFDMLCVLFQIVSCMTVGILELSDCSDCPKQSVRDFIGTLNIISSIYWIFVFILNMISCSKLTTISSRFWLFRFRINLLYFLFWAIQFSVCGDVTALTFIIMFIPPSTFHILLSTTALPLYWRLYLWSKYYENRNNGYVDLLPQNASASCTEGCRYSKSDCYGDV